LQELIDDPLAGASFADRYVIEDCIGEGGMGRVYRARHQYMSRRFAIKVLYGDHATNPHMRDRFAREAESASRLDHPNVISVVDFGETDEGLLYLVMDFVEGNELAKVIAESGPLASDRIERILRGVCHGLAHAHDKDLVHRDFKGENVILAGHGDSEAARIVDFGIAFMLEAADLQRLTTEGMVLGTPAYMSPEQATGMPVDRRTDLFSLGVLLYEMLAGVLPFEGPPLAIARQNVSVAPPPIAARVPGMEVPRHLEAIAMRLLEKRPEDRYQTAHEVLAALDMATRSAQPAASPAMAVEPAEHALASDAVTDIIRPRRVRSQPLWLIVAVALTVATAAAGITFSLLARSEPALGDTPADVSPAAVASAAPAELVVASAAAPAGDRASVDPAPLGAIRDGDIPGPETSAPPGPELGTADQLLQTRPANKPSGRQSRTNRRGRPPQPPQTGDEPPPPDSQPDAPISTTALTARYKAVGEAILHLGRTRGDHVANPLRGKYGRIPLADALRTPSLRTQVDRELRDLKSEIDRELQKDPR
jgi:eukaryotic-like serine/threonine-protein kinase